MSISDVEFKNLKNSAGSLLNITNTNATATLSNVNVLQAIDGAIHNDGTLKIAGVTGSVADMVYTNSSIVGTGKTEVLSGGFFRLGTGAKITQSEFINSGSADLKYGNGAVTAKITNLAGTLNIGANQIKDTTSVITNNGNLNIFANGGQTLTNNITGSGTTQVYSGTLTANSAIANAIMVADGATLNIGASNIKGNVTLVSNSVLNLTGGTLGGNISNNNTYGKTTLSGNVNAGNHIIATALTVASGANLTINAANLGYNNNGGTNITNNGTITFTGGTYSRTARINGML